MSAWQALIISATKGTNLKGEKIECEVSIDVYTLGEKVFSAAGATG
jgi:hypothetical protein